MIIENNVINTIEIKKSKFITLLFPIHSISEINEKLKQKMLEHFPSYDEMEDVIFIENTN